ncbi:hypothetical protein IGI04_003364, partial [Brassica rapa subsp. trilocularis]
IEILYSAIYAANTSEERIDLWAELLQIHSDFDMENNCWIVGGDMNQILYPSEHSHPNVSTPSNLMYQLQDCFLQAGLFDLRYLGPCHTWSNNCPTDPIAKKLDRLLINSAAISSFPQAIATFLPPSFSDHTPCLLDLSFSLPKTGTHPFKFQNYLTKHPNFSQLVQAAWLQAGGLCQTLVHLCWKLKQIKGDLKNLNKENYSKIQERVRCLTDPSPDLFQAERELHQKWSLLREIEEAYFRQKSRINWLREGDLNTAYFHRICQVRASYNAVRAFLLDTGEWITDPIEMSAHAISHFQSKTKLTHLSFADDLLIFIDGSIESVQCVMQVLKDFEKRSGLAISMPKTSFFASGLTDDEINRIQASTGMICGSLPFRYLGVPLNSRKLSLSNCNVLQQEIKSKFSS